MRITRLAGIVCAGLLTVSCHSGPKGHEKAAKLAQQYLTKTEFAEVQKQAENIYSSSLKNNLNMENVIYYWDSILCINKKREGFLAGEQQILDSIAGKKYPLCPKRIVTKSVDSRLYLSDFEGPKLVKKYYTNVELGNLVRNQPGIKPGFWRKPHNEVTAYYGEQAAKGAYRQGFKEGAETARRLYL